MASFLILGYVLLSFTVSCVVAHESKVYAVVIDAGSTGTRAFVFTTDLLPDGSKIFHGYPCGKSRLGLSSFAGNHSGASEMFLPLLDVASKFVPVEHHKTTPLFVKGTAGMRLLDEASQERLWDSLVHYLRRNKDIPFHIDRHNFGTISGHQEAFYAVLASNYIIGSIDGNLK